MTKIDGVEVIINDFKENFPNDIITCVSAFLGSPTDAAQVLAAIIKESSSLSDKIFYRKLSKFIKGSILSDDDRAKMRAFLASNGCAKDNCIRILDCIDKVESEKKIEFFSNATRCALSGEIDLPIYFRIINAIKMLLEDDLEFLKNNIYIIEKPELNHYKSNFHVQALSSVGAMCMITTLWKGGEYAFTPFAKVLDASAIRFEDDAKYPDRKAVIASCLKDELNNKGEAD